MLIGRRCEHPGDVAADRGSHDDRGAAYGASDDGRGDRRRHHRADDDDPDDNDVDAQRPRRQRRRRRATIPTPHASRCCNGILDAHQAAGEFVGARIALLDADGAITEATAGTQIDRPASAPVDLDTVWNIGSLTKTMVAVVVLQLADEGRLDLDAGIAQYMPDLEGADQITPRQLLQHTSGLTSTTTSLRSSTTCSARGRRPS